MNARKPWQGMLAIARFNWPFYVAAATVFIGAGAACMILSELVPRLALAAVLAGAAYFVFGSLGVSHLIYDRSDLYRWRWLERVLPGPAPQRAVFCHCGFDETSTALRARFPSTEWLILDHYDPTVMTEPSIRRARRQFPPSADTLVTSYDHWPVASGTVEAVFGMLAIHELRSSIARSAWFAEARRCLCPNGRIVLAEHVRDAANFLAFGPGFLHFHSRENWRGAWQSARLRCADEFRVTPWVRIWVLEPV